MIRAVSIALNSSSTDTEEGKQFSSSSKSTDKGIAVIELTVCVVVLVDFKSCSAELVVRILFIHLSQSDITLDRLVDKAYACFILNDIDLFIGVDEYGIYAVIKQEAFGCNGFFHKVVTVVKVEHFIHTVFFGKCADSKEEYKEQKEKIEKALLELTEEYERMLATEDAIQNPDICWDEIQSSLDAMIDFSNPQIDRHIIRKFVSKIVPNGRNHFRWYMNLDGKDTTTLDMVTEGRKNNAVISFNDDEEDEPPLHIGDVIGLTELQQYFPNLLKNENQNGIISNVAKCGKKSSLDAILHRLQSKI